MLDEPGNEQSPIAPERQEKLREWVGRMIYNGLRKELELVAEAAGHVSRGREVTDQERAEIEFIAAELKSALDRAVTEPTGDLERGRVLAREKYQEIHGGT